MMDTVIGERVSVRGSFGHLYVIIACEQSQRLREALQQAGIRYSIAGGAVRHGKTPIADLILFSRESTLRKIQGILDAFD